MSILSRPELETPCEAHVAPEALEGFDGWEHSPTHRRLNRAAFRKPFGMRLLSKTRLPDLGGGARDGPREL